MWADLPWWVRVAVLMAIAWGWVYLITDVVPAWIQRYSKRGRKR